MRPPPKSSHLAAAGTSYWIYCFLHSGVRCARRGARRNPSSLLPSPSLLLGPAVTGGGGGGNSDSDSSHMGPGAARRCASLLRRRRGLLRAALLPSSSSLHSLAPPRPSIRHRHGNRLRAPTKRAGAGQDGMFLKARPSGPDVPAHLLTPSCLAPVGLTAARYRLPGKQVLLLHYY